jgi:biopolymer transport protein ExbB
MDFLSYAVEFFKGGGPFMYPILAVLAVGAAISVERYVTLSRITARNQRAWDDIQVALMAGDFDKARELASGNDALIARLLAQGLDRQGMVRRREDIETAMEEGMMEILPQLEKRTPYLALGANIATLLGLLGTITGLISAFTAVSSSNPAEKADLLAASISVAMNTTAFGLIVAIPLLITNQVILSKTNAIVDSLEMAAMKAVNVISAHAKRRVEV